MTEFELRILLFGLAIASILIGFQHSANARLFEDCLEAGGHQWVSFEDRFKCSHCGKKSDF